MRQQSSLTGSPLNLRLPEFSLSNQRKLIIGVILLAALVAFEIFNFDTTQFALRSLLGEIEFLGLQWATILAIAFCSIDFAGLIRLFTPERGADEPREVWYLMGAWLLGATLNAVMTWWAVSLTLLDHQLGNEVLSREQLLRFVPIFVAVLVWLTRILFIGSFTIAGEHLFEGERGGRSTVKEPRGQATRAIPKRAASSSARTSAPRTAPRAAAPPRAAAAPAPAPQAAQTSMPVTETRSAPAPSVSPPLSRSPQRSSRIRQRPPVPNGGMRKGPSGVQAKGFNK